MNIGSSNGYPSANLSNFHGHRLIFDDVEIYSPEGFLQSLKFESKEMQEHVCKLVGIGAKRKGRNKKWWRTQTLYWKGLPIQRKSKQYQNLLDRFYMELYKQNESFRKALHSTTGQLTHSIGRSNQSETVLTVSEFCGRLMKLRDNNGKL